MWQQPSLLKFLSVSCIIFLLSVISTLVIASTELPSGIIKTEVAQASAIRLSDMDGNIQTLRQYRGRWVFVHFWASWCGPCRREMPAIQQLHTAMKGKDLAFMLINTAESEDTVFSFLGAVAPGMNSLLDRDGLVTEQWKPRGLPATYLVDPQGYIRYQALGGRAWHTDEYLSFLTKLMIQKPPLKQDRQ